MRVHSKRHQPQEHQRGNEVRTLLHHMLLKQLTARESVAQAHKLAHRPHHGNAHRNAYANGKAYYNNEIHCLLQLLIA